MYLISVFFYIMLVNGKLRYGSRYGAGVETGKFCETTPMTVAVESCPFVIVPLRRHMGVSTIRGLDAKSEDVGRVYMPLSAMSFKRLSSLRKQDNIRALLGYISSKRSARSKNKHLSRRRTSYPKHSRKLSHRESRISRL